MKIRSAVQLLNRCSPMALSLSELKPNLRNIYLKHFSISAITFLLLHLYHWNLVAWMQERSLCIIGLVGIDTAIEREERRVKQRGFGKKQNHITSPYYNNYPIDAAIPRIAPLMQGQE